MIELLRPFFISFLIGMIIGLERERSHPINTKAIGMRTFTLVSLAGTLVAYINQPWLSLSSSLAVFGLIIASYIRSSSGRKMIDLGITTEISAAVVYCLGYITLQNSTLAISIGVITLAILFARKSLHKFARDRITRSELHAAVVLLLIALVVLSLLPNKTIDPWHLINPQRLGIILLALGWIQFGGYLAIHLLGDDLGIILTGFCGGLISSTAVFVNLPQLYQKRPSSLITITAAAVYATVATLVEILVIVALAAPLLLPKLQWPIVSMIVIGGSIGLIIFRRHNNHHELKRPDNPLDMLALIRLTAVIAGMLLIATIAKNYVGTQGLQLFAFIGGLFELQSTTLAISTLYTAAKISQNNAIQMIGIIVLASFISKFGLLWVLAHNRFALLTSGYLTAMLGVGFGIFKLLINH